MNFRDLVQGGLLCKVSSWFNVITWLWPRRIWCFIVGHREVMGNWRDYEDDYCYRCFVSWPQEKITVSVLLNRAYVWAVEHGFPEWLDLWLMEHVRLPKWWEY